MKKKCLVFCIVAAMTMSMMTGCGDTASETEVADTEAVDDSETEAETSAETEEEKVYTADEILSCLGYDVTEYVKLCDYTQLTVDVTSDNEVTEEDIDEMVEAFAAMYPNQYVKTDRTTVQDGDIVNIDYVGYHNGTEFDGGSAEDYDLKIGSDTFIDGFEDGLIGATVGEKTEVDVTFPDDYSEESLAGEDCVFEVTVNSIREPQAIEYEDIDDQWVVDNFSSEGFQTMEDFRSYVEQYLESLNEQDQDTLENNAIINKIIDESEVTIPDGYLDQRIEQYKETVYKEVEDSGESFEDRMGVTEEEFLKNLPASMETRVTKDLVLEAVVAELDLEITQSDYDDYVNTYLNYYSYTEPEQLYEQLAKLSELDGDDYCLLGYAEHQAWVKVKNAVTIIDDDETESTEE